jgi:hypothetical protein
VLFFSGNWQKNKPLRNIVKRTCISLFSPTQSSQHFRNTIINKTATYFLFNIFAKNLIFKHFFVLFIWRKKANKKMLSTQKKSTFLLEQKNVWTFWNLTTSTQNVTPFVGNVIKSNCFVTCLLYTFSEIHFELKSNSKRMALKHIMSFYSIRSWN